ncbi:MAG: aldehyde dehydrogenase family protein [Cyclobacteriaceae bacterium]
MKKTFHRQQRKSIELRSEKISLRKKRLEVLEKWMLQNREAIKAALASDLGKSAHEADISEVFPALSEVRKARRNLNLWSRAKQVKSSMTFIGTRAKIAYEPKGVCLIISPWNYPFMLAAGPLISALSAGNTVFLKPSEFTPATSALLKTMVEALFDEEVAVVYEGDANVAQQLLQLPFNHIFFTGSPAVGKIIMKHAAAHLSSVTLELGGKSPTIVDETASIKDAAHKIAWGKWINAGQTCVAPDHLYIHRSISDEFITQLKNEVSKLYGKPEDYTGIVNEKHFDRLSELLKETSESSILLSGKVDKSELIIDPVICKDISAESGLMREEIFGPILPIIEFEELDQVVATINEAEKPLALYLFSKSRKNKNFVLRQTSSGTVVVNDCVLQFAHPHLPFGGVNNSGFGKSHGAYGFRAFSHEKAVLKQKIGLTMSGLLYPPANKWKNKLLDMLIKYF